MCFIYSCCFSFFPFISSVFFLQWALSPAKIQQLRPLVDDDEPSDLDPSADGKAPADSPATDSASSSSSSTVNSGAARAMFNVKQRLAGLQHKDQLSVEGQVNALIQEATDIERLAKLYFGWSAFV